MECTFRFARRPIAAAIVIAALAACGDSTKPPVAASLAFDVQPSSATAGASISPAVRIRVLDADGNTFNGAVTVTLALGGAANGAVLAGTTSGTAANGAAAFSGLRIEKAGSGYVLNASAPGLTGATSSEFAVTHAAPAKLRFVDQPTQTIAGKPFTGAVSVEVTDQFDNRATSATTPVTLAILGSGGGAATGTTTTNAVAGVATFPSVAVTRPGSYSLTASAAGLSGATSALFVVDATALARFCPTDGGSAGNFASIHDAIAATQAGGTIVVCDGAHEVSSAIVDRPLTVAAERPHAATLTTSGPLPILRVINSSPGTTTIRDLTFVKNGGGVALDIGTGSSTPPAGRYDQVMVENNRFTLSVPHGLGVRITPSEIGTAKVTIRGSTFTGGWRGVWAQAAAAVDVLGNTFSAQVPGTFEHNASVEFTDGGPYTVRNNVVTDCPLHCIQVRSVVANISDNTLETTVAATTLDGISIFAGTTTVARNIIRGIGEVVRRDDHNAYAFKTAGIRIALEGTATLTENTITNANYGITTLLGATVTGSDNTVTVTFAPVPLTASGPHLHRNDFTDYIGAAVAGDAPAGALSCNYWGPNGPFIPTGMEHVFTPFSLVPIANKPEVACP